MKLRNKVALITGGSSGIGKAISKLFQEEGCKVIVFDKQKPDYDINFYKVDISKESEIEDAFKKIDSLDILVNNAGIYFQSSVEDTSKEDLDKIIDLDFKGTYLVSKHSISLLRNNKGSIINISSGLSIAPEPESPAYCSAKAAINMLTRCMAQQYAKDSIRVNAILPGPIDTFLLRNSFSNNEEFKEYVSNNPMGRVGKPEEVAKLALFLASEDSGYMTGGLIPIDGGESSSSLYSK